MSFLKFGCKPSDQDPLLEQLHSTFHATPYLPPSNDVQPLMLVGHRGQTTQKFGPFSEVLKKTGAPFILSPQQATAANYELKKTSAFNGELGLNLLDGIFKGFNISIEPLKGVLKKEMELSLSFQQVRRLYFHHTVLGSALQPHQLDLTHPSLRAFLRDKKPLDMYIAGSVLQSRAFTIHLGKSSASGLQIEAPVIEQLADVGLNLQGNKETELRISHTGKEYLSFAFSCFQLSFSKDTGSIFIEEEVSWAKSARKAGGPTATTEINPEISFINPQLPAIMMWDE